MKLRKTISELLFFFLLKRSSSQTASLLYLKFTASGTGGWEVDLPSGWQREDWAMPSQGSTRTCLPGLALAPRP